MVNAFDWYMGVHRQSMLNVQTPPVRIAAVLMLRFHVITQGWSRRVAGVRAWLHRLQLMRLSRRAGRGVRSPPLRWDGKISDSHAAQRARRLLGQPRVEAMLTERVTASRDRGSLQRLQAQGAVSRRGNACWHGQRCASDFALSGFSQCACSRRLGSPDGTRADGQVGHSADDRPNNRRPASFLIRKLTLTYPNLH